MDGISQGKGVIKDRLIEVKRPLICLPIVARDQRDLMEQASQAADYSPDFIEWRADGFDWSVGAHVLNGVLEALKRQVDGIPLIFTLRSAAEGGSKTIPGDLRLKLLKSAIGTGIPDMADMELANGSEVIQEMKEAASRCNTKLILSYHDFNGTPEESVLIERMEEARDMGADIAKMAVMARNQGDVLRLLNAVYRAKNKGLGIPITAMAMGRLGAITRITGGFFGSDMVYASGRVCSAPGQIPVRELRSLWEHLYNNCGGRDMNDYSDDCPCE